MNWWKRFKKWEAGEFETVHCPCGKSYVSYSTLPGMIGISGIERLTKELTDHMTHFKIEREIAKN